MLLIKLDKWIEGVSWAIARWGFSYHVGKMLGHEVEVECKMRPWLRWLLKRFGK